jgi:hypothetical protein
MQNNLFLICPTDGLEPVINTAFKQENYFYTSLGNSFISNKKTIKHIVQLIEQKDISDIYFIISNDNKIIIDALGNQCFSGIKGLNHLYNEITIQKKRSERVTYRHKRKFSLLSFYLNKKINELQLQLNNLSSQPIVGGKIYSRNQNEFIDIYSSLVCLDKYHLN